jgi:tetratricopeptide (TPR) repeat protein
VNHIISSDDLTEAIEALEDAIPYLDEENRLKAIYLIGESYNALNNFEEAARYYRIYLARVDDEEEARIGHYGLGWVYHKQDIFTGQPGLLVKQPLGMMTSPDGHFITKQ